jgi:threonine dehydrogenase-like Zn-dependent dehydrogenase
MRAIHFDGTCATVALRPDPVPAPDAALVIHEIQLLGSRCGPFPPALRALERGDVEVDALVTARAAEPGALKVLIDCS